MDLISSDAVARETAKQPLDDKRKELLRSANNVFLAARSIYWLCDKAEGGAKAYVGSFNMYFKAFYYFKELNPGLGEGQVLDRLQAISDYLKEHGKYGLPILEKTDERGQMVDVIKTAHGVHSDMLQLREAYQQLLRKAEIQKEAERL